jgi:predicted permease
MVRTFFSMRGVRPGFNSPETLQTTTVSIPRSEALKEPELLLMQQAIADRLAALPGVSSVSLIGELPMTGSSSQDPIFASDHTYASSQIPPLRRFITAAPGTFQTLGVPLLAGREYSWTDIHERRRVVIIADNFAREYWGSATAAIGKQIRSSANDPWSEVIGVVGDVRHDGVDKAAPSSVYWPQRGNNSMSYLVRSERAGSESLAAEIRQAVWAINPAAPLTEMRTLREVYERSMARTAFTLALLAVSGLMALLLAAVGIYAVIAYTVAQRTREIGIRLALGAQQSSLKMLFVRNGLLWGGVGAAAGLCAAAALARLMSALLYQISPFDPLTYGAVAGGLLVAAAVASYLPARRVARVDPVEALRAE